MLKQHIKGNPPSYVLNGRSQTIFASSALRKDVCKKCIASLKQLFSQLIRPYTSDILSPIHL